MTTHKLAPWLLLSALGLSACSEQPASEPQQAQKTVTTSFQSQLYTKYLRVYLAISKPLTSLGARLSKMAWVNLPILTMLH